MSIQPCSRAGMVEPGSLPHSETQETKNQVIEFIFIRFLNYMLFTAFISAVKIFHQSVISTKGGLLSQMKIFPGEKEKKKVHQTKYLLSTECFYQKLLQN